MSGRATSDCPTLDELAAKIRDVFPELDFSKAELIVTGDDNLVVVLDGERIAGFPRNEEYRGCLAAELNLLSKLGPISPLPVPRYECVSPDRSFGVYKRIKGREMTPEVFSAMAPSDQKIALTLFAEFLSTLHSLPAETIAQPDGSIARTWSGEQFTVLYRRERRVEIASIISAKTLARFDAFHDAFETVEPWPARLAHIDLTDDPISVLGSQIAGIIDFSDAAFGDPASDFAWFWRLGEAHVERLLGEYSLAADDPMLKTRSHWRFVRYMINQLWYGLDDKWNSSTEQWLAELEPHLNRLGF